MAGLGYLLMFLSCLCPLAIFVLFLIFIIRAIMKRKKKWLGISAAICGFLMLPMFIGGAILVGSDEEFQAEYGASSTELEVTASGTKATSAAVTFPPELTTMTLPQTTATEPPPETTVATTTRPPETTTTQVTTTVPPETTTTEPPETTTIKATTTAPMTKKKTTVPTTTAAPPPTESAMLKTLMDFGYTKEHALDIQEILNAIGIDSITLFAMTGEAESGLNAVICYANGSEDEDSRFTFTTENGVMFYASFLGVDLYDIEQGGIIGNYKDVHIPETDIDVDTSLELQIFTEDIVLSCLKYPSTASFSTWDWGFGRSDDNYQVVGVVNATNGFGVPSDMAFSVWFTRTETGYTVDSVVIDGQKLR